MSEKEKEIIAKIASLPEEVRERFLTMAEGAAIAAEEMRERDDEKRDH